MSLPLSDAIPVLDDCLQRLGLMAKEVAEAASPPDLPRGAGRVDLYALLMVGAVYELCEGIHAETRAKRPVNAARLARHLYEFDVETSWVLAEPGTRVERRVAEDIRLWLKLSSPDEIHVDVELPALQALVAGVKSRVPAGELGRRGELIPSRRQMAKQFGQAQEYDRTYGRLSHASHPGLLAGGRFIRRVDAEGRELWRPPRDGSEEAGTLLQAGHSAVRCIGRLAPRLGLGLGPALAEIETTIRLIGESEPPEPETGTG